MAIIDINKLTATLMTQVAQDKGATQAKLKAAATQRATVIFNDGVIGMRKEFEEDPVTREIDGGIAAENISNTLGGGQAPDNLFAFIGFTEGDHPTEPIRKALEPTDVNGPRLGPAIKGQNTKQPTYTFTITAPKLEEIYHETPLPWGPEMSWAEKVETDIPGFARFLAAYTKNPSSRSGGGLQTKGDLPSRGGAQFTPPENGYLTRIFRNFIAAMSTKSYRQRFR